jgi:hypothetical protein
MAVATYVTPQVLVYQEFALIPDEITDSLRALIAGPHAFLRRHSDADEKPLALAGDYDPAADNTFPWPGRPAGAVVDDAFVKVYIDDAQLQYFQDLIGGGQVVVPVAGSKDRIAINGARGFRANGAIGRLLALGDRDVQAGDKVHLRGVVGGTSYTLDSYVRGLAAEAVAAVTGPAVADANNWGTQAGGAVATQVAGEDNTITLAGDVTGYSAYADGDLVETYTIEVVQGSTGADLTTAVLRITSASGHDDDLQVQPAAAAAATPVGDRGLTITFTRTANADDLLLGQKWTLEVTDNYTALAGTSSGTYSGAASTTYVFECTRGGNFGDPDPAMRPQMRAYTTTGVDSAIPVTLNAAATTYPVGTKGVLFTFTGTPAGVAKGDKFYVAVTAAGEGRISTLILGHNLPTQLLTATDLDLTLSVLRDVAVPELPGDAPNWTRESQQLTLAAGLTVEEPGFTTAGAPTPLPVTAGTVYVEYRAWLADLVNDVGTIYDVGQLDAVIPGPLSPDNPLKWGVYKALANANGTQVKFTAVADPDDLDAWSAMIALLVGREDVYNIVPLTHDRAVQDLVAAHCNDQSSPEHKAWRTCFVNLKAATEAAAVDAAHSSDGAVVLARIMDDPDQAGGQNVRLTVTSGNGGFLANGVRAGDTVRTGYTLDAAGATTWDEYTVDATLNEDELRLSAGPATPITVPQKVEVWHNLTKDEIAADLAARAASFGSRRVKAVWPDEVGAAGVTQPGYFLCAALAGLRSGVVPHQGLTNLELAGFDDLARTTKFLNGAQLAAMAQSGVWIVTQDPSGEVFTRHALTTDRTSVETSEEMVTANFDSISYLFARRLAPYIGLMNVTPDALLLLGTEIDAIIGFLRASVNVERLGPQVIDATVIQLRKHDFLPDRVVATIDVTLPAPLNHLELHVVV